MNERKFYFHFDPWWWYFGFNRCVGINGDKPDFYTWMFSIGPFTIQYNWFPSEES